MHKLGEEGADEGREEPHCGIETIAKGLEVFSAAFGIFLGLCHHQRVHKDVRECDRSDVDIHQHKETGHPSKRRDRYGDDGN